jgi:hypothetical protein
MVSLMLSLSADARASLAAGDAALLRKVRALKSPGLSVMALAGEQDWVTSRESTLPKSLSQILQIQQRHALFDGLHLDIEPQLLSQWRSGDRAAVAAKYLDLLGRIRSATKGISLEVTTHPNYAEVNVGAQNFLRQIITVVDRVSLMAYRDQPAAAVSFARSAIAIFKQTGCSWRFGVLVNASREANISYAGTPSGTFQDDMIALDRSLRDEDAAGYAGLIFEDYRGLRTILQSSV